MQVELASAPIVSADAEVLIVPELEGDEPSQLVRDVDVHLGERLARARTLKELTGKLHEVGWLHSEGAVPAPRVLTIGLGKRDDLTPERVRRAASVAARQLRRREVKRATMALPPFAPDSQWFWIVRSMVDGLITGDFDVGVLKSRERQDRSVERVELGIVAGPAPDAWREEVRRGTVLGEAANLARRLALQPGNRLTPTMLADEARTVAAESGLECDVLDAARLGELGAGALLGVSRGSLEPPCLIVLRYRSGREGSPVLALIGKGVTFDSGGISIKPAAGMQEMKYDMAGGAATIGAMRAIAQLRPNVDVIGLVPATENLPSDRAMKPGDVLTAMDGTTVEVVNTDAEGRLILADALAYAQKLGATHLVDAATLTGGVIVALGHHATGLFGRPSSWMDQLRGAAERAGERVWELPLYPEYREQLKSDVADISNSGGRYASACTGATFIGEFAKQGVPWAHLDIAGTSHTTSDRPYQASGPTAVALRTMVELALEMGKEEK